MQLLKQGEGDHQIFFDSLFMALHDFGRSEVLRDDCTAFVIDLHGDWRVY